MNAKIRDLITENKNVGKAVELSLCNLHFNLRKPKSKTATPIYAIIYIRYKDGGHKQFKIPIGMNVLPSNWDCKREDIIINGTENKETINVLNCISEIIFKLNLVFRNIMYIFVMYPTDIDIIKEIQKNIKKLQNNSIMNSKKEERRRGVTATKTLINAFDQMYTNTGRTESTIKVQKGKLDKYLNYIKTENVTDSAQKRFNIEGLNAYRSYLLSKNTMSDKQSYKHVEFIASLINYAAANRTRSIGFNQITLDGLIKTKIKRDAKLDNKHTELTEQELEILKDLKIEDKRLELIRDMFLFQCTIGCRFNDLCSIIQGNFRIEENQLIYNTEETNSKHVTAFVPFKISPIIRETLDDIINGKYLSFRIDNSYYNLQLKRLLELGGLNRMIKYKDANGNSHSEPLYSIVSSHCARVTAATHLLRKYGNKEFVYKTCGWKDAKMLDEIYARLSVMDEAKNQNERMEELSSSNSNNFNEIEDLRNALGYLGAAYADYADIKNVSDLYVLIRKYEGKLLDKGVDYRQIKEIYNEQIPMSERINKLNTLVSSL